MVINKNGSKKKTANIKTDIKITYKIISTKIDEENNIIKHVRNKKVHISLC